MEYRKNNYFNEYETYLFENNLGTTFESKVEKDKKDGLYYTTNPNHCKYKATSVKCEQMYKYVG